MEVSGMAISILPSQSQVFLCNPTSCDVIRAWLLGASGQKS